MIGREQSRQTKLSIFLGEQLESKITMKHEKISTRSHTAVIQTDERTKQYQKRLNKLYSGFIKLDNAECYRGISVAITHVCKICNSDIYVTPKILQKGRGCKNCSSTSRHYAELKAHNLELLSTDHHLVQQPAKFRLKQRQMYLCNVCNKQHYARPKDVMTAEYKCPQCVRTKLLGAKTTTYNIRLAKLYDSKIECLERYNQDRPLSHLCSELDSESHRFLSTVSNMLAGDGCPRHTEKTEKAAIKAVTYRNREFRLGSRLQQAALAIVCAEARTARNLKTKYEHPIPALVGSHIPTFFIKSSKTLIDVISYKKWDKYKNLIAKSYTRASTLGLKYAVVIIQGEQAVLLRSPDWLIERSMTTPKDWEKSEYNVGPQNRRMKIFRPK